jgi:hypothetical protein
MIVQESRIEEIARSKFGNVEYLNLKEWETHYSYRHELGFVSVMYVDFHREKG